jgi:hypothetical protein
LEITDHWGVGGEVVNRKVDLDGLLLMLQERPQIQLSEALPDFTQNSKRDRNHNAVHPSINRLSRIFRIQIAPGYGNVRLDIFSAKGNQKPGSQPQGSHSEADICDDHSNSRKKHSNLHSANWF